MSESLNNPLLLNDSNLIPSREIREPFDLLYDEDRFWNLYNRAEDVIEGDLEADELIPEGDREAYNKAVPDSLSSEAQLNLLVVQRMRAEANNLLDSGEIDEKEWQKIQNSLGAVDRNYWADSVVQDEPLMAAAMPIFIGADYIFKKIAEIPAGEKLLNKLFNYVPGRSQGSFDSVKQGVKGAFSGIMNAIRK